MGALGPLRVALALRCHVRVRQVGVVATGGDGARMRAPVIDPPVVEDLVPAGHQAVPSSWRTLVGRERDVVAEVGTVTNDLAGTRWLVRSERPAEQHVDRRTEQPDVDRRAGLGG